MRHLSLAGIAAVWALAACHDTLPGPSGPNHTLAAHFDSLSAQATAASQDNRAAALDLGLHAIADGGTPGSIRFTTGTAATDTAAYFTIVWSTAKIIQRPSGDTVTDSLLVLFAWRGTNADTILIVRAGHPGLATNIQSELATLGLTIGLPQDSLASAVLITTGNTVAPADSGSTNAQFGVLGSPCSFIVVASVTNDSNSNGATCEYVLTDWAFTLRFSPSVLWSLAGGASPGVVLLR
jgi:hypothetical protein